MIRKGCLFVVAVVVGIVCLPFVLGFAAYALTALSVLIDSF